MKGKSFIILATCQSKASVAFLFVRISVSFDTSIMPQSLVVNMYTTSSLIRENVFSPRNARHSYVSSGSRGSADYCAMDTSPLNW